MCVLQKARFGWVVAAGMTFTSTTDESNKYHLNMVDIHEFEKLWALGIR